MVNCAVPSGGSCFTGFNNVVVAFLPLWGFLIGFAFLWLSFYQIRAYKGEEVSKTTISIMVIVWVVIVALMLVGVAINIGL